MRVPRKDSVLNDALEVLDEKFVLAQQSRKSMTDAEILPRALELLTPDENSFIDEQVSRCISDRRYFMENFYVIRDERGRLKTLYEFWSHQDILYETIEDEWERKGCCRLIVLKPRQAGSTTFNAALIFHATIFVPNTFSLVMAQDETVSTEIYQRIIDAYHNLPWWLRPEYLSKQQGKQVIFQRSDEQQRSVDPGLGSTLHISNAQKSTGVAIGRTIKNILACLSAKNYVTTSDGYALSIASVRPGMEILVPGGKAIVKNFSCRPAHDIYPGAENGYSIRSWCNPAFPLEGTGNHAVECCELLDGFRVRGERPVKGARRFDKVVSHRGMKDFRSITRSDFLVVPVTPVTSDGEMPGGGTTAHRPQGGGSVNTWYPPCASREFGFALGLYLAEGSISNSVTITLDEDEVALADRFAAAVGVEYGKVNGRLDSRTTHYHFYNAAFRNWLRTNIGVKDEKRIPRWAWTLGREFLSGIVEGMILGDGHLKKDSHGITFCSVRSHLALALREAVCSLGHGYGGIADRDAGFHYNRNCRKIWTVSFGRLTDNALRGVYGWGFNERKSDRDVAHYFYNNGKTEVYVRVRRIDRIPLDKVYDIEVDTDDHVYLLPAAITHNSEMSRWPDAQVWTADIKPSLNAPDMLGIVESTAFGRSGLYYNMWKAAESGKSIWRALFIPVYKVKKYFLPVYKSDNFSLNADEKSFRRGVQKRETYTIPLGYFKWRREQIIETINATKSDETFLESYPETSGQAFISSGFCAFPRKCLNEQESRNCRNPISIGEIEYNDAQPLHPLLNLKPPKPEEVLDRPELFNRLWVWCEPDENEAVEYYIGADVASGTAEDYSDAVVYRIGYGLEPNVQVAEWHGWVNASYFAHIIAALGYWYHTAEIAVEYARDGITTGNELRVSLDYPAIYRWRKMDRLHTQTTIMHWLTNHQTRDDAINRMSQHLLDKTIIVHNRHLIEEMRDFGRFEGETKAEGMDSPDDMVMANIICMAALYQTGKRQEYAENAGIAGEGAKHAHLLPKTPVVYNIVNQFGQDIPVNETVTSLDMGNRLIADMGKKYGIADLGRQWRVVPVMVSRANTCWSPIFDSTGAEHELSVLHNLPGQEQMKNPDAVSRMRQLIHMRAKFGEDPMTGSYSGSDSDTDTAYSEIGLGDDD